MRGQILKPSLTPFLQNSMWNPKKTTDLGFQKGCLILGTPLLTCKVKYAPWATNLHQTIFICSQFWQHVVPKCVSATSRLGIPTVPEWCTVSTTVFSKPCSAPPSVCNEIFAGPAAAFGTTRGYLLSLSLPAVFPSPACDGVCFCGIQTTRQCGGTRPRIELDGLCIHSLLSLDNGKKKRRALPLP